MASREHLIQRTIEAIKAVRDEYDIPNDAELAEGVVNTLFPQIFNARQFVGVPEGAGIVVAVMGGYSFMWYRGGKLHGDLKRTLEALDPEWVISRYGPLTVVWMP